MAILTSYQEVSKMSIEDNMPNGLMKGIMSELERIAEFKKSPEGKYKVIGIDKFDGGDWVQGEYDSAKEAVGAARNFTKREVAGATDSSIATVYYAYDPKGRYLGGDTWHNE